MYYLSISIIIVTVIVIDYLCWIIGQDNTIFFKDSTKLEKDLREIQKLEAEIKIKELKERITR